MHKQMYMVDDVIKEERFKDEQYTSTGPLECVFKSTLGDDDLERLMALLLREDFADVIVCVGDYAFECDMNILQYYSTFFATSEYEEFIYLPDDAITIDGFYMVYDWMLSDMPFVKPDGFIELYQAADYLGVHELQSSCWDYINEVMGLCDLRVFRQELIMNRRNFLIEVISLGAMYCHMVLQTPRGFYILTNDYYVNHVYMSPTDIGKFVGKAKSHQNVYNANSYNCVHVGDLGGHGQWSTVPILDFYRNIRDKMWPLNGNVAVIVIGGGNFMEKF